MRAMILAAGESRRLQKRYPGFPKLLLQVKGKTILERNLIYLKQFGIRKIVMNLYAHAGKIMRYVKSRRYFGLEIQFSVEEDLLGTAGGVANVRSFFKGQDFLVLYGDNLMNFDLRAMVRTHRSSRALITMGCFLPQKTAHTPVMAGRVFSDGRGYVRAFVEKRSSTAEHPRGWVHAGLLALSPKIFSFIPEGGYYDFAADLFPKLLKRKKRIRIFGGTEYLLASDTPQTLAESRRLARRLLD